MDSYTTCYIEKDNKILMLYRNKKENDVSEGKYIGIGGKVEKGETIYEAAIREVKEETNLTVNVIKLRGLLVFVNNGFRDQIYIFSCNDFDGELKECEEGDLYYIEKSKILDLNIWEGDKYFIKHILDGEENFFIYEMHYENGKLINVIKHQ